MMVWLAGLSWAQDADYDSVPDVDEDLDADGDPSNDDSDLDTIPDYLDPDDDNDRIDTLCEVALGVDPLRPDVDGDTLRDGDEWFNFLYLDGLVTSPVDYSDDDGGLTGLDCFSPWDRDSDGVLNVLDSDDDGDGLSTGADETGIDVDCLLGTVIPAGDGIPDYLDRDSDNDGIPDGLSSGEGLGDADGDNISDFLDCVTVSPEADSDVDGVLNGTEDELCPLTESFPCSLDPDVDGDGVIDGIELGSLANPTDTDGDTLPDWLDEDDDQDGRLTRDEAGMPCDEPLSTVIVPEPLHWAFQCEELLYDLGTNDLTAYPDLDSDGLPDLRDPDDDGDTVLTSVELELGMDPGQVDSDGDGVGDGLEFGLDTDSDTVIDALDPDDDGDGHPTLEEGTADADMDGVPAYLDPDEPSAPPAPEEGEEGEEGEPDELDEEPEPKEPEGCGCQSSPGRGVGWLLLLLLWRRR
jgi:hypothetical protein